jgi:hypothetical protein
MPAFDDENSKAADPFTSRTIEPPSTLDLRDRLDVTKSLVLLLHAALGNQAIGSASLSGGQHLCDLIASEIDAVESHLGEHQEKKRADRKSREAERKAQYEIVRDQFDPVHNRFSTALKALGSDGGDRAALEAEFQAALSEFAAVEPASGADLLSKFLHLKTMLAAAIDPERGSGALKLFDSVQRDSIMFAARCGTYGRPW